MHELIPLALEQVLYRDACRLRNNARDVVRRHAVVQHRQRALCLALAQCALRLRGQLPLELGYRREAQLRRTLILTLPLCDLELELCLLKALLQILDALQPRSLCVRIRQRPL